MAMKATVYAIRFGIIICLLGIVLGAASCGAAVSAKGKKGEVNMTYESGISSSAPVQDEPVCDFVTLGEGISLGTWMWDAMDVLKIGEALEFLTTHNISEVYVSLAKAISKEKYRKFVGAAAERGIRVALIGADAEWATKAGQKNFDSFLQWFSEYQAGCANAAQRFYGLHMDVEPHQLPEWLTEPDAVRSGYMEFVRKSQEFCAEQGVLLELDIPFWFDELDVQDDGETMSLAEFCIQRADTVLLMSYRDNAPAVFECGWPEFTLAEKYGKKLVLAVETGKIYEDINITFHHLGTRRLYEELRKLREIVESTDALGEIGYAIHYYESWRNLPPDGHPKGADYPYAD